MPKLYLLNIRLKYLKPAVTRDFVVPATIKLSLLHDVIQIVMGWEDIHLHGFRAGDGTDYQIVTKDSLINPFYPPLDERKHKLCEIVSPDVPKLRKFTYTYDYRTEWTHEITVKSFDYQQSVPYSIYCIKGKTDCPPEDVSNGFDILRDILASRNPRATAPSSFDLETVNAALRKL